MVESATATFVVAKDEKLTRATGARASAKGQKKNVLVL